MADDSFARRLMPVIGKPVATLFIEEGTDRHFIPEAALMTAVSYLGGKFLDGFIDGLGIKELGKAAGGKVKAAVLALGALLLNPDPVLAAEHGATLQAAAGELAPEAGNDAARQRAEEAVRQALQEQGVPAGEAARIAKAVGQEVLPAGASRG